MTCEHCASNDLHWFTPRGASAQALVLLCMTCRKLTIRIKRGARQAAPMQLEQAAAAA